MTLKESEENAAMQRPVEKDMFDRHMRRARENDIKSRQKIFVRQSEVSAERQEKYRDIDSSIY